MRSIKDRSQKTEVRRQKFSEFRIQNSEFKGFSLIELLVVIGIIAILMGLLFPVISRVRTASYNARTQQIIASLSAAIDHYYQEHRAYPGPLSNDVMNLGIGGLLNTDSRYVANVTGNVTMSENLVLALSGGLRFDPSATPPVMTYDATLVGRGPKVLATTGTKTNQQLSPYIDGIPLSPGNYIDTNNVVANDSNIPEYMDGYPNPMPILYLRARTGASTTTAVVSWNDTDNSLVTTNGSATSGMPQYGLNQITAYTGASIGTAPHGLSAVTLLSGKLQSFTNPLPANRSAANPAPYDAYAYLEDPNNANQPRRKDAYILISAGPDRTYGTDDDITNFGSVR